MGPNTLGRKGVLPSLERGKGEKFFVGYPSILQGVCCQGQRSCFQRGKSSWVKGGEPVPPQEGKRGHLLSLRSGGAREEGKRDALLRGPIGYPGRWGKKNLLGGEERPRGVVGGGEEGESWLCACQRNRLGEKGGESGEGFPGTYNFYRCNWEGKKKVKKLRAT